MDYQNLTCEIADGVATVTVNRPDKLNALNRATVAELQACCSSLADDAEVRAVVLTGAGEKAFVAGADISELANLSAPEAERYATAGHALMWRLENLGKPVIAAINGFALGGGLELALACTFRYAAGHAKLGLPELNLGLIPGFGGTQRLPRVIGRGPAAELILTGAQIDADEARALGLVNRVVPGPELLQAAWKTARAMAGRSQVSVRAALKSVVEGANMGLDAACRLEAAMFGVCAASEDAHEGCRAFLEKRKPDFKDA